MMRIVVVGLPLLFLGSGIAYAGGGGATSDDKTLSPYFFVEGGRPDEEAFPLKSTRVSATVSGVIASVVVKQVYENAGAAPLNARYVFPASTRAAVNGMTIRLGTKTIVARIKEREQAQREFQAAKREGKTASLLAEERPNVFTMSVANVMPKDRVEVELIYTELILPTEGVYQFVYPTVVGPRYANATQAAARVAGPWFATPYLHAGQKSPAAFDIKVNVSSGIPLHGVDSPSHVVHLDWEGDSLARISLVKVDGGDSSGGVDDGGDRDFILNYRLAGKAIEGGLMLHEGPKEKFFLMTVQPPAVVDPTAIAPREYVFILDVSGSMHGFPLDTAKQVIRDLIGNLRPTDTFNVVLFSGASRLWSPSSLPASRANIERAIEIIDNERGGGGTELEGALQLAIGLPRTSHVSRTLAVITDGFITEEPGAFALVRDNLHDTNVFAFGIGSSVNRHLIEGLARAGQGAPFVVTDPSQAAAIGARFRHTVESPMLTEIHFIAENFDVYDVEPSVQPDLFAERPLVVFGKWRGPRTGRVIVTGRTATGTFRTSINVADTESRPENAALPLLWARTRIARLSDFNFEQNQAEATREVTSLGLTYSLLTAHTSFIAVLQQIRNPGAAAKDVDQPLPLPQGVSDLAVGEAYASGAEPELWLLGVLAILAVGRALLTRYNVVSVNERAVQRAVR